MRTTLPNLTLTLWVPQTVVGVFQSPWRSCLPKPAFTQPCLKILQGFKTVHVHSSQPPPLPHFSSPGPILQYSLLHRGLCQHLPTTVPGWMLPAWMHQLCLPLGTIWHDWLSNELCNICTCRFSHLGDAGADFCLLQPSSSPAYMPTPETTQGPC
jgi:hypothetical protein